MLFFFAHPRKDAIGFAHCFVFVLIGRDYIYYIYLLWAYYLVYLSIKFLVYFFSKTMLDIIYSSDQRMAAQATQSNQFKDVSELDNVRLG